METTVARLATRTIVGLWVAWTIVAPDAAASGWRPSPGHTQMALWPPTVAAGRPGPAAETTGVVATMVAGRPWRFVNNVSQPTLTLYPAKGRNSGAAIIVFPGGGYQTLAIDLEGTEVCEWLASRGIAAVLLKYRVPNAGVTWDQRCGCDRKTRSSRPLEDAQRAIALVRHHAAAWHIDPHRIGVIGFSAGGHLVASVSTRFERRVYAAADAADSESCRPDFALALYPGHLFDYDRRALNQDIHVTRDTPPTFLVHAQDDHVDGVSNTLIYYDALRNAGVATELHLYPKGGHAFGLRRTSHPITAWPHLAEAWLSTIGMSRVSP